MLNSNNYITTFFINRNGSVFYILSNYNTLDSIIISDIIYSSFIEDVNSDNIYIDEDHTFIVNNKLQYYDDLCMKQASNNSAFQFIYETRQDIDLFQDDCFKL